MATAAALFDLQERESKEITISVPLTKAKIEQDSFDGLQNDSQLSWERKPAGGMHLANT